MTSGPILSTKLQLPAARPDAVVRPRLLSALDEGLRLGRRLTLVSAPAGFGKTTLLRQWAASGKNVAWLTADAGDDDPDRFLRYVDAALAGAWDHPAPSASRLPPGEGHPPSEGAMSAPLRERAVGLINALAQAAARLGGADGAASPLRLILDDYHAIRQFAVHDLVAFLLDHFPPGVHLAIGTREDPPLPLARLRAMDQVTEVRERVLRFDSQEAGAFLGVTMRLSLSPASVALLTARTEGWIAGLQLAGLALRQAGSADDFVSAFAGDDRYIVDYLMAEVLGRQPEPVQRFLRQTSVLDRLSGPLCDALTGRDDSQAVLERLEAANLFVVSLDNRREWYRYHVLFADVLRLGLGAQEQAELHERAAAWFRARAPEHPGAGELALHHARLAARGAGLDGRAARSASLVPQDRHGRLLVEPLTEREREVLALIAAGLSNQEIADRLVIAHGTVKRHINNIHGKLGVRSRTQAVAVGREIGLL